MFIKLLILPSQIISGYSKLCIWNKNQNYEYNDEQCFNTTT